MSIAREARVRWNAIRNGGAIRPDTGGQTQGPQPAGEGSPSIVVGQPGWEKRLEEWGMNPAFDEDDAWTKRIRGY
jgi:hypothetical protein